MKMQKSDIFVEKNLRINTLKIKKYCKVGERFHYTGDYRGVQHSICNLKYSVSKKISIVLHNRSDYDYHFIMKELAEEFKKQFTSLGKNTEKYITFTVPELIKMEKKLQNLYPTYYNLLVAQDLW